MSNRRQSLIGKKLDHLTVIAKLNKRGKANHIDTLLKRHCQNDVLLCILNQLNIIKGAKNEL